jgi:polyisoprenoid-binding protein YceI
MNLQPTACCHSERSEESLVNFRALSNRNSQRCFASLNMTDRLMRGILRSLMVAFAIAGLNSIASAKESYKFDPSGSTIGFSVHQFLGTTHGKFTRFSGRIEVDREHPENSSVTAQIDVRSIVTHIKKRDDHLRSAEFFNVEKFPRMTFKSRSVKRTGPQSGDILGDLTMHGVMKPITLHVKLLTPVSETARTRWSVTTDPITRRDFNLMFTPAAESVSGISQTVAINIEIEAKRAE